MATRVHHPEVTTVPHIRIAFGGDLGVPKVEVWSNTVRFVPTTVAPPTAAQLQAVAAGVAPNLQSWFGSSGAFIGQAASLVYVKASWILASGLQRDTNTAIFDLAAPIFGSNVTTTPIWEQSYVLTLRSALRRGRTHAGRIYPPLSGPPPGGTTPYCGSADADAMALKFAGCLQDMRASIITATAPGDETGAFRNISPGDTRKGTTPMSSVITSVVCDRVADIMHSRTNRVPRLEAATAFVTE